MTEGESGPVDGVAVWTILLAIFSTVNLVHAISGGLGNALAIALCYPLESARTRLQVDDKAKAKHCFGVIGDILKEEGIGGVYRGLTSLVLCLFCNSFVYFFVFYGLKAILDASNQPQDALCDLIFGMIAGVGTVAATNPLWVVNTRLKLQGAKLKTDSYKDLHHPQYAGIIDCFRKMLKDGNGSQLWSGVLPSLFLVSNPAIQFMVYESLKRIAQTLLHSQILPGPYYFTFGAVSKAAATLATYPLQLIQTRIRAGYEGRNLLHIQGSLLSVSGVASLYRGLESKLTQTVLTAAFMLMAYEELFLFVSSLMGVHAVGRSTSRL